MWHLGAVSASARRGSLLLGLALTAKWTRRGWSGGCCPASGDGRLVLFAHGGIVSMYIHTLGCYDVQLAVVMSKSAHTQQRHEIPDQRHQILAVDQGDEEAQMHDIIRALMLLRKGGEGVMYVEIYV